MNRTALIALAATLNSARNAANAIDETAPENGVYGEIKTALLSTLAVIVGADNAVALEAVYQALLDGATVPSALAYAGIPA